MLWRIKRSDFEKQKGGANRKAMKNLIQKEQIPGIIAYLADEPVGWCSVEPRDNFPALARSRILKPVDDQPVWSIVCFFIDKKYRNAGLSIQLIEAVIQYVKERGGRIVEGYPVEPKKEKMPSVFAWTGLSSAFIQAGFHEVARRSDTRPIMRYIIAK
jgi:GNAT superfamily N-acetyltransferase